MRTQSKPASETERDIFPTRLRVLMEEWGATQEGLAKAIGVRRQTISLYCNGQSKPDWTVIYRISKYFHVSSDWLLGLSEYRHKESEETLAKDIGLSEESVNALKEMVTLENSPRRSFNNKGNVLEAANLLLGSSSGNELLWDISAYLQHSTIPDVRYVLYSDGRAVVSAVDGNLTAIIDAHYDVMLNSREVLSNMQEEKIIGLLRKIRTDTEKGSDN